MRSRGTARTVGAVALVLVAVLLVAVLQRLGSRSGGDGARTDPDGRGTTSAAPASSGTDPESGLPWVPEEELPVEARETLRLIDRGGPFPYPDRDGATFRNSEGLLPEHQRGYYAEYTVPTPGSDDRGARRIVVGDGDERYWTADHYASFERILRSTG